MAALFRYPVKSMRGEPLAEVGAGWHGLDGDRRLAIRRTDDRGGFPWLTASRLPELLLFTPLRAADASSAALPTHIRTPDGDDLELYGAQLSADIGGRCGLPVDVVHLNRGVFDEASISLIAEATVAAIGEFAAVRADVRRFRPNILVSSAQVAPFDETRWVGGLLTFGDADTAPAVFVTNDDERCAMVNYDPDTARADGEVLKAIVRRHGNRAGVYGAVVRPGLLRVGQPVYLDRR